MKEEYDLGLLPKLTTEIIERFDKAVIRNCTEFGCDKIPGKVDEHRLRAKFSLIRECTLTKKCFPHMTLGAALDNSLLEEKANHIEEKLNEVFR